MSKTTGIILAGIGIAVAAFLALWLTDVDVTDGGELPSVDVDVDGDMGKLPEVEVKGGDLPSVDKVDVDGDAGRLPKVDVDVADIDIKSKEVDVPVPDVDVKVEEKKIKLPTVEVTPADAEGDEAEASPELDQGEGEPE